VFSRKNPCPRPRLYRRPGLLFGTLNSYSGNLTLEIRGEIVIIFVNKKAEVITMRRAGIALVFLIAFISTLKSSDSLFGHHVKNTFELTGGGAITSMSGYFKEIKNRAEGSYVSGAEAAIGSEIFGGNFNITFNSFFASDEGLWSFYVTNHYFAVNDSESSINYSNGQAMIKYNSGLSADYIGIGARKYTLEQWVPGSFNMYFGADIGIGTSINTSFLEEHYNEDGIKYKEIFTSPNGMVYGLNAEAGGSYWFDENFGLVVKGGYRFIQGRFTGTYYEKIIGGNGYLTGEGSSYDVDYSGPFITAGLAFSFDSARNMEIKKKEKPAAAVRTDSSVGLPGESLPEADIGSGRNLMEYEQLAAQGNAAYERSDFLRAAGYFEQALRIKETPEMYRQAAMSYYHIKNHAKTVENFEKYMEMKPEDIRTREWVDAYKRSTGF